MPQTANHERSERSLWAPSPAEGACPSAIVIAPHFLIPRSFPETRRAAAAGCSFG
jgi:hypothetical protein